MENKSNNRLYNQLKANSDDEFSRNMKKSLLMKSFSNTKDNRGNCAME